MFMAVIKAKIAPGMHTEMRELSDYLQFHVIPKEPDCDFFECYIDGDNFVAIERWSSKEKMEESASAENTRHIDPLMRRCIVGGEFRADFINVNKVESISI
ncbi:hypothetical protein [Mangrovibacter yixingensis]|uniref:hypothetical protein n=1 Tax=Mangrovibacter yixingensis TaxID=1529639 RepID=UPI001CFB3EBE|nr:hypothetical protein [Mangrovibacter yixingensis]